MIRSWRAHLRQIRLALFGVLAMGVIVTGVLAGLTQLAMPWLEHHPQHVEHWLSARLHRPVKIAQVRGNWVGGGPLLALDGVQIGAGDAKQMPWAIPHAELAFDLYALFQRNRAMTEFRVSGLDLALVNEAGRWQLHGLDFGASAPAGESFSLGALGAIEISHLKLHIQDATRGLDVVLDTPVLRFLNRGRITRVLGRVRLPDAVSQPLDVVADLDINARSGRLYVGGGDIELDWLGAQQSFGGIKVDGGRGSLQLWARLNAGQPDDVRVRVALTGVQLGASEPLAVDAKTEVESRVAFDRVAFAARWQRVAEGWNFDLANFVTNSALTASPARVTVERRGDEANGLYRMGAQAVALEPFGNLAMLANGVPEGLRHWLYLAHPRGTIAAAQVRWAGALDYDIDAKLRDVDLANADVVPGIEHININLHGDAEAILLQIPAQALRIDYPHVFRKPFRFTQFGGDVIARRVDDAWRLETDRIGFEGEGYGGELRGTVDLHGGQRPFVDMYAALSHADVVAAKLFWPTLTMPPKAIEWLDRALVAGHLIDGRIALRGDLADWPFHDRSGRMVARAGIADMTLDYDHEWPRAEKIDARVTFLNDSLGLDVDAGESMGNRIAEAHAAIADFGPLILDLSAKVEGSGSTLLGFLRATPIGKRYQEQLKDLAIGGKGVVAFTLNLPIKQIETLTVDGSAEITGAKIDHNAFNLHFIDATGHLRFNQNGFAADQLDVRFRERAAKLSLAIGGFVSDPRHAFEASLSGRFPIASVFADVPALLPMLGDFPGESTWTAHVGVDNALNGINRSALSLDSDMRGTAIGLPAPFSKSAEALMPFHLDLDLPYSGQVFSAQLGDIAAIKGRLPGNGKLFGARIDFGAQTAGEPPAGGIAIGGRVKTLEAGAWLDRVEHGSSGVNDALVQAIDLHVDDFVFAHRHFPDLHLGLDNLADATSLTFDGAPLKGRLAIPKSDQVSRGIHADFERIHWPETPPDAADANAFADMAPASVPPLHISVGDFQLGSASFGSAQFDSHPVTGGMQVDTLTSHSPNITMQASGAWTGTAQDNRSHLAIDLSAQNLGHMMDALGFPGLIDGGATHAKIDATFDGPPSAFALPKLDGTLSLDVAEGRILDVHPGAGRIFGLFSLTEIPRRLSLDFSDFFQSGLSFNSITGTFRLADGNAYTDDLTIKSPAAEIVVTGRTGLRAKDYDQQMNVTPHAGSTLAIVGAIAGGPVGAAAGLVMQGILNKPLGKAIARRYTVTGSWDKPKITQLARTGTGKGRESAVENDESKEQQ
ncbi:MAG: YhdP family protein [Dokdonella sp.]